MKKDSILSTEKMKFLRATNPEEYLRIIDCEDPETDNEAADEYFGIESDNILSRLFGDFKAVTRMEKLAKIQTRLVKNNII